MMNYPDQSGWYLVKQKSTDRPHKRFFNRGIGANGKFINSIQPDELWWSDNITIPHDDVESWETIGV